MTMGNKPGLSLSISLCLTILFLFSSVPPTQANTQTAVSQSQLLKAGETPSGLSPNDWGSIQRQITAKKYRAYPDESRGFFSSNPAHGWQIHYGRDGTTRLTPRNHDAAAYRLGIKLEAVGYRTMQKLTYPQEVHADHTTVTYRWNDNIKEWWSNSEKELEQWFLIERRLPGATEGEALALQMTLDTDIQVAQSGDSIRFENPAGSVIIYNKLKVWDADGRVLPARMRLVENRLSLLVDDSGAVYPVTVDPSFQQEAYLKASNTGAQDRFGISVAISGDTVVVGARSEESDSTSINGDESDNSAPQAGAAYVFVRSGTTWSQQAYLKASNTDSNDLFGIAVDISGDTIVVGAWGEDSGTVGVNGAGSDNSASNSGAAYIFIRNGTTWTQQAYLKASNAEAGDLFGASVGISGDFVVVGAYAEDSAGTGVNGDEYNDLAPSSGAAYVFSRNGTVWSQQAYLKASNTVAGSFFGVSVAISGDTLVVGADGERSGSTGVNGDEHDWSAPDAGAAYVFTRSSGIWSQQAYLKASNTDANDNFGISVSIDSDTVVVGAYGEDSSTTGVNGAQSNNSRTDSGSAYVFIRSGGAWSQQAYLKASNTDSNDWFGHSVAVSGDSVLVGARYEQSNAIGLNGNEGDNSLNYAGAAYLFTRIGSAWSQQTYLKASNTDTFDEYGSSVAISGDTVVVGAAYEQSAATGVNGDESDNSLSNAGAVYVYGLGANTTPTVSLNSIDLPTTYPPLQPTDTVTLHWSTTNANSTDNMVLSIKRDSASGLAAPDGVNWYRFTDAPAYGGVTDNDGSETVTIPSGLAEANDWRFYVRHVASDVYDASSDVYIYAVPVQTYPLTVIKSGTGSGTVTSSPGGIDCGIDCSENYPQTDPQTVVRLTAQADTGSVFSGWSGGGCSGTDPCDVTMDAEKTVSANFSLGTHTIATVANPIAGGTITCDPNPVSHGKGSSCTAKSNPGYSFVDWSGDCTGAACNLTNVTSPKSVTANFSSGSGGGSFDVSLTLDKIVHTEGEPVSDVFSIYFKGVTPTKQDAHNICNEYFFAVEDGEGHGAEQNKEAKNKNGGCYYISDDKLVVDFKVKPDGDKVYFEDGTTSICTKSEPFVCQKVEGIDSFSVYGTLFDLKKHAFSFKNTDWNKATLRDGKPINDIARATDIVGDYLVFWKRDDLWDAVGRTNFKSESIWSSSENDSDGLCTGMAASSASFFNNRVDGSAWGAREDIKTGWKIDIDDHWNDATDSANKPYKPFNVKDNDIYAAYENGSNINAFKKIVYYQVTQNYFVGEDWVGGYDSGDFPLEKRVSSVKELIKTNGMVVPLSFRAKFKSGDASHNVAATQYIGYKNKDTWYLYDNNFPGEYGFYGIPDASDYEITDTKNQFVFSRFTKEDDVNGLYIYEISKIGVFIHQDDTSRLYGEYFKSSEKAATKDAAIPKAGIKQIDYAFPNHTEVSLIGGNFVNVAETATLTEPVLLPPVDEPIPGNSYILSNNIFYNKLFLPYDKKYKVTVRKIPGFAFMKVYLHVPNGTGGVEVINYENLQADENDPTLAYFYVGAGNQDKDLVLESGAAVAPDYDETFKITLWSVSSPSGVVMPGGVDLRWTNPLHPDLKEVVIVRKEGSKPADIADGTEIYRGFGESFQDNSASGDTKYFYAFFAVGNDGSVSDPEYIYIDTGRFTIYGRVVDAQGVGAGNVEVRLLNSDKSSVVNITFTDKNGYYAFNDLLNGTYHVAFSSDFYSFANSELAANVQGASLQINNTASAVSQLFANAAPYIRIGDTQPIVWDGKHIGDNERVDVQVFQEGSWTTIASGLEFGAHAHDWVATDPSGSATVRISLQRDVGVFAEKDFAILDTAAGAGTGTEPIPTLPRFAILLLGMMLAAMGIVVLVRRSATRRL